MRDRLAILPDRLGYRAELRGRFSLARACFTAALLVDARDDAARFCLATVEMKRGHRVEACHLFRRLAERGTASVWCAHALIELGNVSAEEQRWDEAVSYYSCSLSLPVEAAFPGERDSVLAHAYCGLANVACRTGCADRGADLALQALQYDPDNAAALFNLAVCRSEQGRPVDAVALARRALELEPTRGDRWDGLGEMCEEVGQPDVAVECYRRAVRLGYLQAQPDLDRLESR